MGQQNQLKEAEEALTTCIYACRKADFDLGRVRRDMLKGLVANFDADEHESACTTRKTDRFISDKQKSISDYTAQLLELREQQRKHQQQELEDQRMGIHHCLSVLAKKAEQARTSSYENFHCESGGLQICASVSGQRQSAKDLFVKTNGSQLCGDFPSSTVEKVVEKHSYTQNDNTTVRRGRFGFFSRKST